MQFLIAGVQKGGTTSLDCYLRQHPSIHMANQKELHYFDSDKLFVNDVADYGIYHRYFTWDDAGAIRGEATPIYSYWNGAVQRIWRYNPEMKLIVLFRDPVRRAWSHWQMESSRGTETESFSVAIRREKERSRSALPFQHRNFSYIDRSHYSEQIRRIYRFFPANQVLFLKSEAFFAAPDEALRTVFSFLEVDSVKVDTSRVHNRGNYCQEISRPDRTYLRDALRWDVEQVKSLLGWECRDWLEI